MDVWKNNRAIEEIREELKDLRKIILSVVQKVRAGEEPIEAYEEPSDSKGKKKPNRWR